MKSQTTLYLDMAMQWIVDEGMDSTKTYRDEIVLVDKSEWKLLNRFPGEEMQAICEKLGAGPDYLAQQQQQIAGSWVYDYVPQQNNGYDCGVCTCMNADFTADDIPLIGMYSHEHLGHFRQKIGMDILRGVLNYAPPAYE